MQAKQRLRFFRGATLLAVAVTGLLLLLVAPGDAGPSQTPPQADSAALPDSVAIIRKLPVQALQQHPDSVVSDSGSARAAREATGTLTAIWRGFLANLPKYAVVVGVLLAAWLLVRGLRFLLPLLLGHWQRAHAITALAGVILWLLALGIAASVLVGDIRALVGSLGLVGLALSWALQTPIESFTGWLLNSFHGYYRIGDRVAVGDVFGDVYRIDFLTTTVWEYGAADRPPGWVQAEQPTGRLITFANNEVLNGSVINYTRDFPYVWDELPVGVANESDLRFAMEVLERVAKTVVGDHMREPAHQYRELLAREGLDADVPDQPRIYAMTTDWSTNLTIRYLVGARQKRRWKSALVLAVAEELARPENARRIISVYPRQQLQFVDAGGRPDAPPDAAPTGQGRATGS